MEDNNEFKGSTKQALLDIKDDIKEIKTIMNENVKAANAQVQVLITTINDNNDRNEVKYAKKEDHANLEKRLSDVEKIVVSLNQWKYYVTGIAAASGVFVSILTNKVLQLIGNGR